MATQTQLICAFKSRIDSFWNLRNPNSFLEIDARLVSCAKKIDQFRKEAIGELSLLFESPPLLENLQPTLDAKTKDLGKLVEEMREIEDALTPATLLNSEAFMTAERNPTTIFVGHYYAFAKRVDGLLSDVRKIYKDSLYPSLQVLQNAKSGWNPSGIVCTVWDYYSWCQVRNPVSQIADAFPPKKSVIH